MNYFTLLLAINNILETRDCGLDIRDYSDLERIRDKIATATVLSKSRRNEVKNERQYYLYQ